MSVALKLKTFDEITARQRRPSHKRGSGVFQIEAHWSSAIEKHLEQAKAAAIVGSSRLPYDERSRRPAILAGRFFTKPNWRHLYHMTNLGFIGAGRMATALATGCVKAKLLSAGQVLASDPIEASRHKFAAEAPGAKVTADNAAIINGAETIVLAVKPQMIADVLRDIAPHVTPRHLLISIAAGIPIARLAAGLPQGTRLIRVMPNTPCLIGAGASCFSRGPTASAEDVSLVQQLLTSVGRAYEVEESQLDAVTGLSGSGPAFVYTVIEALAEGGRDGGLSAELALELAAQTAAGAAAMVLETKLPPAELRNQVTSPGGTTLAGLQELNKRDGATAFRAAVEAATRRSIELGKT